LAVNAADVATPDAFVTAVLTPPAKVPLAPVAGAANVTVTPATPFTPTSRTVATSGAANVVLIVTICPDPLVTEMDVGGATVFAMANVAGVCTPATVAVTV
jgi:hypothetical protein